MNGPEPGQTLDYLRAVRSRWRLVAWLAVVALGTALAVSLSSPKQYDATVDLLLREQEPVNSLLDPGAPASSSDAERELNTNVDLIKVGTTAEAVRERLRLDRSVDDLLDQVETQTAADSNVVSVRVRDRDPQLAARIANEFASSYVQFRVSSARRRYTEAADLAQRQLDELSPEELASTQGRELEARQRELEIAAALQTGGAEIVRPAAVPKEPSRPRPLLSGLLGLALGVIVGVCLALALELADRRFKDEASVEEFFGLPILAVIPRPARRTAAFDDRAQQEAYGLLAANIRLSMPGQPAAGLPTRPREGNVLMITSPSPGEGKTSVCFGVARAYARLGLRVVVVEADLRRPAFERFVDVSSSRGLTAVLRGRASVDEELMWIDGRTMQPSPEGREDDELVGVLPAGGLSADPQLMLVQPAMHEVVERARSIADIVVIDTAPVGTVNDPVTLSRLVDEVVLVARLDQTTKDAARRALRVVRNFAVPLIGVVVTDTAPGDRYGYYAPLTEPALPDDDPAARVGGRA